MTSPDLVIAGLLESQSSLGLKTQWQLRFATITVPDLASPMAVFDGEGFQGTATATTPLISLVGYIPLGVRVAVIVVPPAGNYVVGLASAPHGPSFTLRVPGPAVGQTKSDATFENMVTDAGDVTIEDFIKSGSASKIEISLIAECFSTLVFTAVEVGVAINGTTTPVAYHFFNPASTHMSFGGFIDVPDVPAGTYDIEVMWRRVSGTGVLTWDVNDYVSIRARETP